MHFCKLAFFSQTQFDSLQNLYSSLNTVFSQKFPDCIQMSHYIKVILFNLEKFDYRNFFLSWREM